MPYNCKNSFSRWGLQLFDCPLLVFSIAMFVEIAFFPKLSSCDEYMVEIDNILSTAPILSIDVKNTGGKFTIDIERTSHSYFYYKERSVGPRETCGSYQPAFSKECGYLDRNSKICVKPDEPCPIQSIILSQERIIDDDYDSYIIGYGYYLHTSNKKMHGITIVDFSVDVRIMMLWTSFYYTSDIKDGDTFNYGYSSLSSYYNHYIILLILNPILILVVVVGKAILLGVCNIYKKFGKKKYICFQYFYVLFCIGCIVARYVYSFLIEDAFKDITARREHILDYYFPQLPEPEYSYSNGGFMIVTFMVGCFELGFFTQCDEPLKCTDDEEQPQNKKLIIQEPTIELDNPLLRKEEKKKQKKVEKKEEKKEEKQFVNFFEEPKENNNRYPTVEQIDKPTDDDNKNNYPAEITGSLDPAPQIITKDDNLI